MSTAMPVLETERLTVRPFVMADLQDTHRVLSEAWGEPPGERAARLPARERWLRWSIMNYEELAELAQPPYGERAVTLRDSGTLIGVVGLVPSIGPFGQLPGYPVSEGSTLWFPEVGLYWAVDPAHQGHGYATEAARGLIDYVFDALNLARVVATTEYSNERSMAVMRKLGMQILRNSRPDPAWFQVVGLLEQG